MLGALARSIATLVLFPYIRAKVLMQTSHKEVPGERASDAHTRCARTRPATIVSTLQRVYSEEGPYALYRGLGPELTRVRRSTPRAMGCRTGGANNELHRPCCFCCYCCTSMQGALSSALMLMLKEKIQTHIVMLMTIGLSA